MARRFGRRRRRRVVWLPNMGTAWGAGRVDAGNPLDNYAGIEFEVDAPFGADGRTTVEFPLFADSGPQRQLAGGSFTVYQGLGLDQLTAWGYVLQRLVGKHFCAWGDASANAQATVGPLQVDIGIIVRRTEPTTGTSPLQADDVDPTTLSNGADPWLYRRTFWLAGKGELLSMNTVAVMLNRNPSMDTCTLETGGTKDGPAFDIRVKRRIGPEERLFMDVTLTALPVIGSSDETQVGLNGKFYANIQYRGLATLISNAGNRRNASR